MSKIIVCTSYCVLFICLIAVTCQPGQPICTTYSGVPKPEACSDQTFVVGNLPLKQPENYISSSQLNEFIDSKVQELLVPLEKKINNLSELLNIYQNKTADLTPNIPPSCDYINEKRNLSKTFLISPDPANVEPFNVTCNFTGNSTVFTAVTIVHHDSESEIPVSSCQPRRCYKRHITYNASLQQIEALIGRSAHCRQFIKYRCIHSILNHEEPNKVTYAAWLSRNGTAMTYWGGSLLKNHSCSCSDTGTCARSKYNCNCDVNDRVERYDEGYLTDKAELPVTELQFGDADMGANEYGWHTLGPLICFGRNG